MQIRVLVPALLLLFTTGLSQKLTGDDREILWHQDQRVSGDSVLFKYLGHNDSNIRRKAAIALGNIQDTLALPYLIPLLDDEAASVRAAASFAIGQIGSPANEEELAERLRRETSRDVIERLLEALGKCGSEGVYDDVVTFGLPKKLSPLKAVQALSIARFALRGITSERGVWFCFDALDEPDSEIRWRALYALWRIAPHGAIDVEVAKRKKLLTELSSDKNDDIRGNLAILLSKTKAAGRLEILDAIKRNEARKGRGNWRVRVNLIRAYATLAVQREDALTSMLYFLSSRNDHVVVASLTALSRLPREVVRRYKNAASLKKTLARLSRPSQTRAETIRGETLVALARHFPEDFKEGEILANRKASMRLKAKVLEALSSIPSASNVSILMERLNDDSVQVAMAAWDFLARLLSPQNFKSLRKDTTVTNGLGERLFRKAKIALLREDMAITTLVANALGDSAVFAFLRQDGDDERAVEELMLAYGKLSAPNDVEGMQAVLLALGKTGDKRVVPLLERALFDADRTVGLSAAAALKRITGMEYADQVTKSSRPLYTDYDWKSLEGIKTNQRAIIRTGKGSVTIQFLKEDAPFTVLSFYKLIRKKFFDGLMFHRVVPNFVVQGGDPRGDGWGGPNYAIRSEISLVNFGRGNVGVASAGKDTEGCQFFITHSPQPHLDGRYTIFARVVSGMSVVDKIQVGDTIQSITLVSK